MDSDGTKSHSAHTGTQPAKKSAGDQDGITGGLGAVEVPEGLGAK